MRELCACCNSDSWGELMVPSWADYKLRPLMVQPHLGDLQTRRSRSALSKWDDPRIAG